MGVNYHITTNEHDRGGFLQIESGPKVYRPVSPRFSIIPGINDH